ncbi:MAG TPA: hypothetical protein VNN19_01750 [bacterium]|nr:hypothetical protein [bacterium]
MSSPRRRFLVPAALGLVLAGMLGVAGYLRPRPQPIAARADPVAGVLAAVVLLERTPEHRLSGEQLQTVLPLLRVLRDLDPSDVEPARALARAIMDTLTPAQREVIQRARQEARAGRSRLPPAVGGRTEGGGTMDLGRRPAARRQLLARLIERLETRR